MTSVFMVQIGAADISSPTECVKCADHQAEVKRLTDENAALREQLSRAV